MIEQIQLLRSYARRIWPYRWVALASATLASIIGWGVVISLPNQYEVSAKIFIDTRSMLKPLLAGLTVNNNSISNSASLMRQTLLTRPNLEEVARKTDLDLGTASDEDFDNLITGLAKRIELTGTPRDNIYEIKFEDSDPNKAKRIVDEILNSFLETALGDSRQDSVVTQKFLGEQISDYEKRLVEAEERLKEFKQKNVGLMPGDGGNYYERLEEAKLVFRNAELDLREAQNRRGELARQIGGEVPVFDIMVEEDVWNSDVSTKYDGRILELESQLDQLLLQYTEKHPDVVGIRLTVKALEEKRQEEVKRIAENEREELSNVSSSTNESLAYQELKIALGQTDADVAGLKIRAEEFNKRVEALARLLDTVPEVEAELQRLDRDYELNKKNYEELLKRRESARLSNEVDSEADHLKLKVIEPPRIPLIPVGPKRILMFSGVLTGALGFGAVLALLLTQITPRFYSSDELKEFAQIPVIGVVTMISSGRQRTERLMEFAVFGVVFLGLIAMYGGLVGMETMQIEIYTKFVSLIGRTV
ncbi:MAG: polysaccharide chain length determinant protein (PEP-CTERM system associated) [Gammaproteobacteria bacterium]|jgi:polysaccharide chain length determinant protein (PEP-CTERM system associated)